jgi:hypothetical protein
MIHPIIPSPNKVSNAQVSNEGANMCQFQLSKDCLSQSIAPSSEQPKEYITRVLWQISQGYSGIIYIYLNPHLCDPFCFSSFSIYIYISHMIAIHIAIFCWTCSFSQNWSAHWEPRCGFCDDKVVQGQAHALGGDPFRTAWCNGVQRYKRLTFGPFW